MMKYWPRDTLARVVLIIGLLICANWMFSAAGHGLTDESTALLLFSLFLAASAAASLWRTRKRLALVTSLAQVSRWSLLIVVLGLINASAQTSGTGATTRIHSFFWSTVAAISFVNAFIRPQRDAS